MENEYLHNLLRKNNLQLKQMNYEVKRMVCCEEDVFTNLSHNYPVNLEIVENLTQYCRVDLPREKSKSDGFMLGLPLHLAVRNMDEKAADIIVYFSMNHKEPSAKHNERKFYKKMLKPGDVFKCHYQNVVTDCSKHPFTVFVSITSTDGFNCQITSKLSKKLARSLKEFKLAKNHSKLSAGLIDGDITDPDNQRVVKRIETELHAFLIKNEHGNNKVKNFMNVNRQQVSSLRNHFNLQWQADQLEQAMIEKDQSQAWLFGTMLDRSNSPPTGEDDGLKA
jgi:hypothetical protein